MTTQPIAPGMDSVVAIAPTDQINALHIGAPPPYMHSLDHLESGHIRNPSDLMADLHCRPSVTISGEPTIDGYCGPRLSAPYSGNDRIEGGIPGSFKAHFDWRKACGPCPPASGSCGERMPMLGLYEGLRLDVEERSDKSDRARYGHYEGLLLDVEERSDKSDRARYGHYDGFCPTNADGHDKCVSSWANDVEPEGPKTLPVILDVEERSDKSDRARYGLYDGFAGCCGSAADTIALDVQERSEISDRERYGHYEDREGYGGIWINNKPFVLNTKCIVIGLAAAAIYALPRFSAIGNLFMMAFLFCITYIAISWYDVLYSCDANLFSSRHSITGIFKPQLRTPAGSEPPDSSKHIGLALPPKGMAASPNQEAAYLRSVYFAHSTIIAPLVMLCAGLAMKCQYDIFEAANIPKNQRSYSIFPVVFGLGALAFFYHAMRMVWPRQVGC